MMYLIIIDIDIYAGGVEREMASYITAEEEEYQGQPWADLGAGTISPALRDYFEAHLDYSNMDEANYSTFAHTIPNPNWVNNGHGKHAKIGSSSAKRYKHHYPAYMSIGICISVKPTAALFEEIKKRAVAFISLPQLDENFISTDINIESFRLVERSIMYTEVEPS